MFDWVSGITIMDYITINEEEESNEENYESEFIEEIVEEIIKVETINENPPEGFLIPEEYERNDPNSDT